jgi:hypothetical protein
MLEGRGSAGFTKSFLEENMKKIEIKLRKKTCVLCHERRARFRWAGRVRWDHFHSLCFFCYRSLSDRLRASLLAATDVITQDAENTFGVSPTPMLVQLERCAYAASSPLTPYAGATVLAATAAAVQPAVLSGGNL